MKTTIFILVAMTLLVSAASPASAATKVFLLAGQSNMAGTGNNSELVGPLQKYSAPQTGVKFWNSNINNWISLQPGLGASSSQFGPELSFGYAMHEAFPNDSIYLVKYAVSGSVLADNLANPASSSGTWKPGATAANPVRRYPEFKATADAALAKLAADGHDPVIAGMLWMQGESDAYIHADAAAYQANLTNLITAVRNDFSTPNMEFVLGRITTFYGAPTENGLVRAAQADTATAVTSVSWFNTDDLQRMSGENGGHYNTQGQIDLGLRFANEFSAVPEPGTLVLFFAAGLLGLLVYAWRKRTSPQEVTNVPEH